MQELSRSRFTHYDGSVNPLAADPDALAVGSRGLLVTGSGKLSSFRGMAQLSGVTGSRVLFNIPDGGYAGLGTPGTAGKGSIVGLVSRAIAFAGQGDLYINGATRSVAASTTPQIILYRSGSYSGAGTGPYTLGLTPPATAPTLTVTPTASAKMSGTYSASIWFVRSATGGRSRAGVASAVVTNTGFKMRLTVAGADLTTASTNGYDRIGIGVTAAGYGLYGPRYELIEIAISSLTTVDGVANSVELDWADAELAGKPLEPIDDYPPPPCVFLAAIEDVLCAIGCYGDSTSGVSATNPGTAIAVSLPVFIESFPPDNLLFLPEAPVGVLPVPSEGFVYIGCRNSLHVLQYTGGSPAVSLKTIAQGVGIAHQNNMWLGEAGRLYLFSAKGELMRMGASGEMESAWSAPVADEMRTWTPEYVVGGYDADSSQIVVAHSAPTSVTTGYMTLGSLVLRSPTAAFTPGDALASLPVTVSGAGGGNIVRYISPTEVVLDGAAAATVTNATITRGFGRGYMVMCCYNTQVGRWGAPIDDNDILVPPDAMVTVAGSLLVANTSGGVSRLHRFNSAPSTGPFCLAYTRQHPSVGFADALLRCDVAVRGGITGLNVYVERNSSWESNSSSASPAHFKAVTLPRAGQQWSPPVRMNVRGARSHRVGVLFTPGSVGGAAVDEIRVFGVPSEVVTV